MTLKDLDTRFSEAVETAEQMSQSELPQDIQLRLYAYYKRATSASPTTQINTSIDLRNAFKTNAWMQVSHLTIAEAKEAYIKMITTLSQK